MLKIAEPIHFVTGQARAVSAIKKKVPTCVAHLIDIDYQTHRHLICLSLKLTLSALTQTTVDCGWSQRESLTIDGIPRDDFDFTHCVADFLGVYLESIIDCSRSFSPLEKASEVKHRRLCGNDITFCGLT